MNDDDDDDDDDDNDDNNNNNNNTRMLRIFRPKRNEVTGELIKLHNDELNDLYPTPSSVRVIKSRRIRLMEHVARKGERRGVYRVLVGKSEAKRLLGRPRCRWEDDM